MSEEDLKEAARKTWEHTLQVVEAAFLMLAAVFLAGLIAAVFGVIR